MWAQRAWVGRYLPGDTPTGRELQPYSRYVNAVEGNTTFYALPPALTIRKWRELADPGFRFVFKVPRLITHENRLRHSAADLEAFVALLEPLGDLVGGLTLQLPPSFGPRDLDQLDIVLRNAPKVWPWSVEVRHADLFGGDGRRTLERILNTHCAERVILDTTVLFHRTPVTSAGHEEWQTKPRVPRMAEPLTDRPIVRFVGSDFPDLNADGLASWHNTVAEWLGQGRTPTFFVHTPDNAHTPVLARGFHDAVRTLVPELDPLTEPWPVATPEQISLF